MSTNLSAAAIDALSAITVNGNAATMPQLDRKTYKEVNAALEVLGGKWNRKAKAHLFNEDPRVAISRVVVDGEFTDRARELEFFETPPELAAKLVAEARILPGMSVLEPSAGKGAIVRAIRRAEPDAEVRACELNTCFQGELIDALGHSGVMWADFLSVPALFVDRVVMNPPFSKGKDATHITEAFGCLRAGGRLVAVAAAGVMFRQEKEMVAFRALVEKHGRFEELPAGSFKSSGTMVNTVMVVLDRDVAPEPVAWRRTETAPVDRIASEVSRLLRGLR